MDAVQRTLDFAKKVLGLAAVAGFMYLGESSRDGGFIKDLWAAAKTAGPFGTMLGLLLFFDERRERREAQRQCNERTVDFIQTNNVNASANESMANAQHDALEKLVAAYNGLAQALRKRAPGRR